MFVSCICSCYNVLAASAGQRQPARAASRASGCCVALRRSKIHCITSVIGADPVITDTPGTRAALASGISLEGVFLCANADF